MGAGDDQHLADSREDQVAKGLFPLVFGCRRMLAPASSMPLRLIASLPLLDPVLDPG